MLSDRDRAEGHGLAAEWLEGAGEQDSMSLAQHCERGQRPLRAAQHYVRAAEQALRGGGPRAPVQRAGRGPAREPDAAAAGALHAVAAEARFADQDFGGSIAAAMRGVEAGVPGSVGHCNCVGFAVLSAVAFRDRETAMRLMPILLSVDLDPGGSA